MASISSQGQLNTDGMIRPVGLSLLLAGHLFFPLQEEPQRWTWTGCWINPCITALSLTQLPGGFQGILLLSVGSCALTNGAWNMAAKRPWNGARIEIRTEDWQRLGPGRFNMVAKRSKKNHGMREVCLCQDLVCQEDPKQVNDSSSSEGSPGWAACCWLMHSRTVCKSSHKLRSQKLSTVLCIYIYCIKYIYIYVMYHVSYTSYTYLCAFFQLEAQQ